MMSGPHYSGVVPQAASKASVLRRPQPKYGAQRGIPDPFRTITRMQTEYEKMRHGRRGDDGEQKLSRISARSEITPRGRSYMCLSARNQIYADLGSNHNLPILGNLEVEII